MALTIGGRRQRAPRDSRGRRGIGDMVTHSRGTLTQAMVADSVSEEDQDAAYSLYFFLGFFSAPIWAIVTGFLFQRYNFGVAFSVMASSYVGALLLMGLAQDVRRARFRAA